MGLFGNRTNFIHDFSGLGVDLHSHVLPGLDDGSPTLEESLKMLHAWVELGYRKVITTPHVTHDYYPNTRERILGQMYHQQDILEEQNIPLELEASGEYRLDEAFLHRLAIGELLPFGAPNYVLVELPFWEPTFHISEFTDPLIKKGFTPILAHPERYTYLTSDFGKYENLRELGLLFQLNLNSLTGIYGKQAQRTAERLIDHNYVEFVGSDAHFVGHLIEMRKVLRNKYFLKLVDVVLNSKL